MRDILDLGVWSFFGIWNLRFGIFPQPPTEARASAAKGVLRYRSPVEQATVTIILPLFSGRFATSMAAQTLAPEEMPARMPSSLARRRAIAKESSLVTWMHSVIWLLPLSSFK